MNKTSVQILLMTSIFILLVLWPSKKTEVIPVPITYHFCIAYGSTNGFTYNEFTMSFTNSLTAKMLEEIRTSVREKAGKDFAIVSISKF